MRRIVLYMLTLQLVAVFMSCEKEIMPYQGKEGVYFAVQHGDDNWSETSWPYQPYSDVDFVRIGLEEVEIPVKVAITGPVKDYDRLFHVEVNPDSTTAILNEHYEAVQRDWVIPAGSISTMVTVRLKRTPDLEETPKTLGLRLIASQDFELSFPEWDAIPSLDGGTVVEEFDASLHSLRMNDVMIEPLRWSGLFGAFSRKKMEFMMEYMGLIYEDFASEESMPMARQMLVSSDGASILIRKFNEGNPILEEDGRLMMIGEVPWTSVVGVPYVPAL